ncbi:MAG: hypothetical protein PHT60_05265 [Acidiphilium sp.]|nr:hypothetical protein [Acidiphilium sp.]MDD4935173.1 hypothetical protein [Acidiphilium sp.]
MKTDKVLIHVRFAPDGRVIEIGERPVALSPQKWFECLSDKAGTHYQPFAGGRGLFRLERQEVDVVKNSIAA